MNLYLAFVIFWLGLGIAMLVWHSIDLTAPFSNLFGSHISAGWLALIMALYNLLPWWSAHSLQKERRRMEDAWLQRQREEARRPEREPDPTFDFSKPPPDEDRVE